MQLVRQRDGELMARQSLNSRTGFTLVELLVVIGIIAALVSILMPALSRARMSAQAAVCASNLRQLGISMGMYVNEFKGYPTMGWTYTYGWEDLTARYNKSLGWQPGNIYIGGKSPMYDLGFAKVKQSIYGCPTDEDPTGVGYCSSYSYNKNLVYMVGSPTWDAGNVWRPASKYHNTSNLALLVCGGGYGYYAERIIWYQGTLKQTRMDSAWPWHNGGSNMLFCDGHVSHISVDVKDPVYLGGVVAPGNFSGYFFDSSVQIWPETDPYMPVPRPPF